MGIPVRKLKEKWLKDPGVRREYERLAPEYALARMLIAARVRAGLTQADVAKRMHTTQSVIARLESGKQKPSLATLEKYAKATKSQLKVELVA
ncbi:MAG: helix-turn-helix transcriptional regulator [Polyangiaceae bacterium]